MLRRADRRAPVRNRSENAIRSSIAARAFFLPFAIFLVLAIPAAHSAESDARKAPSTSASDTKALTIYTYDSFAAKGGAGTVLANEFRKKTGAELKFIAPGDALQTVAEIERDAAASGGVRGDAVIGVDLASYGRVEKWGRPLSEAIAPLLKKFRARPFLSGVPDKFLPFDYGYFAFIENRSLSAVAPSPKHWVDFFAPAFARKLLLEDPRTSTPGLGFVLFLDEWFRGHGSAGDETRGWETLASRWRDVRRSTLTIAPGWSQAYALFLKGEAPYAWSYTTSEAYHLKERETWYRAIVLEEPHPVQVEGAVLLRDSPLARELLALLVDDAVQSAIPETQWMYPVRDVKLPGAFESLREPARVSWAPTSASDVEGALSRWKRAVSAF